LRHEYPVQTALHNCMEMKEAGWGAAHATADRRLRDRPRLVRMRAIGARQLRESTNPRRCRCSVEPAKVQGIHAVEPTRRIENETHDGGRGMFESFEEALINVGETTVFTRSKGYGPPLLLLHGIPETHLMWHAIAPRLANTFTSSVRTCAVTGRAESRLRRPLMHRTLRVRWLMIWWSARWSA
jgi:hypothetical protein